MTLHTRGRKSFHRWDLEYGRFSLVSEAITIVCDYVVAITIRGRGRGDWCRVSVGSSVAPVSRVRAAAASDGCSLYQILSTIFLP